MQIRTKLTLQFITVVAAILLLSLAYTYYKFRELTYDEYFHGLRSKALMTGEMVLANEANIQALAKPRPHHPDESSLPFHENVAIYNDKFERVFAYNLNVSEHSPARLNSIVNMQECRFQNGTFQALGVVFRAQSGRKYVIIAESIFRSEELGKLRNILLVSFFLGIGIVAAGGWIYAGQALAPVSRIVSQVERILPTDLSARLDPPNKHDEISRLVITFNRLLERIQFAFRMQRSFISNVSHELKNPLSVIISQIEVALSRRREQAEYRQALESVLEDTRELAEVADKLLLLARVHSEGANIVLERIRLDELMLQTRSTLLRLHPDYHIAFDIEGMPETEEELCIMGNEPLLRSALMNLLDNGCKFSKDKRVDVRVMFDLTGKHSIEIADRGPGIPEKDLQMIFQPFFRSSQHINIRGSGIGLSLVDSVMRLHKVAVDVFSVPGKGTTFRLNFPGQQAV